MNILKSILDNNKNTSYFFLSDEANAPDNVDTDLRSIIEKAKPIAKTLGRHINIYGFDFSFGI